MESIIEHRRIVQENILKSFGVDIQADSLEKGGFEEINTFELELYKANASEEELNWFEKAKHNVGDVHPNGKWVWKEISPGKFDWRTLPKKKDGGTAEPQQGGAKPQANTKVNSGVDDTSIDDAEYQKQLKIAKEVFAGENGQSALNMGLTLIQNNIDKTKKDLTFILENRPGAKATIKRLQGELTKFISQKKAANDVLSKVSNKKDENDSQQKSKQTTSSSNNDKIVTRTYFGDKEITLTPSSDETKNNILKTIFAITDRNAVMASDVDDLIGEVKDLDRIQRSFGIFGESSRKDDFISPDFKEYDSIYRIALENDNADDLTSVYMKDKKYIGETEWIVCLKNDKADIYALIHSRWSHGKEKIASVSLKTNSVIKGSAVEHKSKLSGNKYFPNERLLHEYQNNVGKNSHYENKRELFSLEKSTSSVLLKQIINVFSYHWDEDDFFKSEDDSFDVNFQILQKKAKQGNKQAKRAYEIVSKRLEYSKLGGKARDLKKPSVW